MKDWLPILPLVCVWTALTALSQTNQALAPAEIYSFGVTQAHNVVCHDFIVTNAGAIPLVLNKVRPSCECLHILSWPRVIAPYAGGTIAVRLAPDKMGPVDYQVFVESSDRPASLRIYGMRGIVLPAPEGSRRDPALSVIDARLFTRIVTSRDEACYISPAEALAQNKIGNGAVLVDVRPAEAFNAAHIPSALNIPSYLIRTKSFLRSANVIMVTDEGGDPALEQTCRDLRAYGFASVSILRGGLNSWRRAGGDLAGDAAALKNLPFLSPADYLRVRNFSDWIVVGAVSAANTARAAFLIPEIIDSECLISPSISQASMVLILDDRGETYGRMAAGLGNIEGANVFYLSGGLENYERYVRMLSAKPGKMATGLAAAGSFPGGAVRRKPCGGCPG